MGDSFRRFVGSILNNLQILTKQVNALMMIAVDEHIGSEEGMKKTAGKIIGGVQYVGALLLVEVSVGNFFNGSLKIKVDELHPFTDAKDRLFLIIEQVQCPELFQSKIKIGKAAGVCRMFFAPRKAILRKNPVIGEGRKHVASAGQKQTVIDFRMLYHIGRIGKDDCFMARFLQSGLIIFMQNGRSDDCDGFHGRLLRKSSYSII